MKSQSVGYEFPQHLAARYSARRQETTVQIVAMTVTIVSFVLAGLLISPINKIRREHQLVIDPTSTKGLPPDLALLGKLGTFRALAIDWASIRAERLKEEGKTYEALQLHQTVCALAPRFPRVWANAAWNMAYNISVMQYTPEARWQWVQNGIKILRDQGLVYNPRSVTLYKELSWIYWHKIGDFMDDEHFNYKRALAVEMERVLGPMPVTVTDEEYFQWFAAIVSAPRDLEELIRTDQAVADLVERLGQVKLFADDSVLDFVARHIRPELTVFDLVKEQLDPESLFARRLALLEGDEFEVARSRLLPAIRSGILRERYHFDLDLMYELMVKHYGPLDWRNAFSHALYWAYLGNERGKGYLNADASESMNTARYVFITLHNLVMRGRLTLHPDFDDPFASDIDMTPDPRYIKYLFETYQRLSVEQFGELSNIATGQVPKNYQTGLVTNMHEWINVLYLEGGEENQATAENFYAWLREYNRNPDGSKQERYDKPVEHFVMDELLNKLHTWTGAVALTRMFVRKALKQFSLGQTVQGITSIARAQQAREYWTIGTKVDVNERRQMPPIAEIVRYELEGYMASRTVAPLYKARLWRFLPESYRQMLYDRLSQLFEKLCEMESPPWNVARAFPEPPGMDVYRQRLLEERAPEKRNTKEQGKRS